MLIKCADAYIANALSHHISLLMCQDKDHNPEAELSRNRQKDLILTEREHWLNSNKGTRPCKNIRVTRGKVTPSVPVTNSLDFIDIETLAHVKAERAIGRDVGIDQR